MKIGFLSNQLDNRGTGNALYNYAHYNEELLGNESLVMTFREGRHDDEAVERFSKRFEIYYLDETIPRLDSLYHIKSGYDDGFRTDIPYLVHAVFDNDPHGTKYATISPWMGRRFNLPYVPHIVEVAQTDEDYREFFSIPKDAIVFGRYGGWDSFDIPFVWDTIKKITDKNKNIYFIFMNTEIPSLDLNDNVIFCEPTVDPIEKRRFINTTDAMIHARARGETFGIAVGEFAQAGKPIITYTESPERAHLDQLAHFALGYKDERTLMEQFQKVIDGPMIVWAYGQFTPENVMKKFRDVFLR